MTILEKKPTFILYADIIHMVKKLPKDLSGELFIMILNYVNGFDYTVDNLAVAVIFEQIKNKIDENTAIYEERVVKRNRINGAKGGRPKQEPKEPSGLNNNPVEPSGLNNNPENPDHDHVYDHVKKKRYIPYHIDGFDFNSWPQLPSDNFVKFLIESRKRKLKTRITQGIIDKIGVQLRKAISNGHTFEECILEWELKGWGSFMAKYMKGGALKTETLPHSDVARESIENGLKSFEKPTKSIGLYENKSD